MRVLAVLLITVTSVYAQSDGTWQELPGATVVSRYNDIYFTAPDSGWAVNGWGQIYRTDNGGTSWFLQLDQDQTNLETHFRSVGFFNSRQGWAGTVGDGEFGATDTTVLYYTENGGQQWQPWPNLFDGPTPAGLCGMQVLNDSTICAVGRVRGPAYFVRSNDGGKSWFSKDLNHLAAGLIDVHFLNPDTGIAVGLSNSDHQQSSGIILATTDGGQSWYKHFKTTRTGEWCWKISFPSDSVGYVSLQRNYSAPIYFLKTTDGGETWEEKLFSSDYYFVQGIGFITDSVGWIGGNSSFPTYETVDGGETWYSAEFGSRVNRLRFFGDTLGYAAGRTLYRYDASATAIADRGRFLPRSLQLYQNFPNPFNPTTEIRFTLPKTAHTELTVYDLLGRRVALLENAVLSAGQHSVTWNGRDRHGNNLAGGIYIYRLRSEGQMLSRKMLLLK